MGRRRRSVRSAAPYRRPLRFEPLEDRRLLAITVNSLFDEADGSIVDGDISLRDAIALAPSGETIDFSVTGMINLSVGTNDFEWQLTIDKDLTINGPGANLLTINAFDPTPASNNGDGSRVFYINDGNAMADKNISISGLTLTGGDVVVRGGAIYSKENLAVSASTICGNSAGVFGGGVENYGGNLRIDNSTISGNSARFGGGIVSDTDFLYGTETTISNSTISGNSAVTSGGGVSNISGLTVIKHSTITDNTAPAAAGSGVASFGNNQTRTEVYSTIIAGNTNSDVDSGTSGVNSFQSNQYNLIGTGNAVGNFNQTGDQTGVLDPRLDSLADNGGPTLTHALRAFSPAFNAGNPSAVAGVGDVPLYDQRGSGFPRVLYGRIDIGAFEFAVGANLVVDTLIDELDGNIGPGQLSLREVLYLANLDPDAQSISFDPSLTSGGPATIELGSLSQLVINTDLSINGPGASLLTIQAFHPGGPAGSGTRIFYIDDGSAAVNSVSIGGLTLTGGDSPQGGGAILNRESLTIAESIISGNASATGGGGIYSGGTSSALTLSGASVSNNATAFGGGIFSKRGTLTVSGSNVSGNVATAYGGGIYKYYGTLSVASSTISGNNSGVGGGGIVTKGSIYVPATATVTASTISGNTAVRGGGIWSYYGTLTVASSTVSGNLATHHGGGLYLRLGSQSVRHSTVTANQADSDANGSGLGGGMFIVSVTATLDHSLVAQNVRSISTVSDVSGAVSARFSLIGDKSGTSLPEAPVGSPDANGNLIGGPVNGAIDPLLSGLLDHGGATKTHALLAGSPAIDAGNPSFNPADPDGNPLTDDALPFDQRGTPFVRVSGGRIDMGAFEVQPVVVLPDQFGDYNLDGRVDAGDYVKWRNTLGTGGLDPYEGADGSGNTMVGPEDYQVWKDHYGEPEMGAGGGSLASVAGEFDPGAGLAKAGYNQVAVVRGSPDPAPTRTEGLLNRTTGRAMGDLRSSAWHGRETGHNSGAGHNIGGVRRDAALVAWIALRGGDEDSLEEGPLRGPAGDEAETESPVILFDAVDAAFATLPIGAA